MVEEKARETLVWLVFIGLLVMLETLEILVFGVNKIGQKLALQEVLNYFKAFSGC